MQLVIRALVLLLQRAKFCECTLQTHHCCQEKSLGCLCRCFFTCARCWCAQYAQHAMYVEFLPLSCQLPQIQHRLSGVLCFFISCSLEHCVILMILSAKNGSYLFHFTSCLLIFFFSCAQYQICSKNFSNFNRNLKFSKERNAF